MLFVWHSHPLERLKWMLNFQKERLGNQNRGILQRITNDIKLAFPCAGILPPCSVLQIQYKLGIDFDVNQYDDA